MKKKLRLRKDRLRALVPPDLKHVVGASDTSNPTDTCSSPTDFCAPPPGISGMCDAY